ncbi:MAG TPA: hypothetical protein VGZ32_13115 [Actinocrinis sp.]|uniref:hypothetical protein n=1 Tax=Actinocrinis sp. TaxID=1920516 RepID=UPI002DDD1FFB|nr:hypothetical protein [Actinocrinis sp.]HEV3171283.1 hypothetical protein [Actinocrinis sp.]
MEADELELGPTSVSAASSAISDRYKTVKPRRVGARIPVTVVKALAADPTVRHSERGRELLRLLTLHAIAPDEWAALVDAVPAHRAAMIVKLAESLSLTWQQFADELRRR